MITAAETKKRHYHPYICTPAYNGQVDSDYAHAMSDASFVCGKAGINITAGIVGNVAFLELARNIFVKKFLNDEGLKDCTHLFFIDGDIKFPWQAFIGLLTSGMPVCAGVYRRRMADEDYPFKPAENPDGGGLWFVNDWLQCERVPTGFLCISREVLEDMAKDAKLIHTADYPEGIPWIFELKHEPMTDKNMSLLIGEDYTFCDKYVAKYNQYIPVWSNLEFSHHGFEGNLWKWFEKEREKTERGEPSKLGKPPQKEAADVSSAA